MDGRTVCLGILLFMWNLAGIAGNIELKFNIKESDGKITMNCGKGWMGGSNNTMILDYTDDKTGEYKCGEDTLIYMKLRTCDNCIELDAGTAAGIAIGNLVASVMIVVAVYFIASKTNYTAYSGSKASDRQNLIQNQHDTYMPLVQGLSSEYSKLERRGRK